MGVNFDLKVDGLDDVIKALRKAEDKDLRNEVFNAGKPITREILEDAKTACPVDKTDYEGRTPPKYPPGNLRDAIKSANSKKKLTFSVYVSDKKAYYAPFVEYGHRTKKGKEVPAQPFLIPAGRKHEREFERAIEKALEKVAREMMR